MGFSLLTTHISIAIALCGLSIASPSSTTDGNPEEAGTTTLLDTTQMTQSPALSTTTTNIDMSADTSINTELIVLALIAIMLCLIVICVALIIAIWKQSAQQHKDSEDPTISVRNGLEAIEGKSPSCDNEHSAVVDMAAANMAAWDSTKSLSSMVSVQSQFYDAQFEAQLANARFEANAIMLNAGGPLMFEIPEFVPEAVDAYVDDLDAMRYVDHFNMGMNDREVSAEDEDDDAVMLEMRTPTANGE